MSNPKDINKIRREMEEKLEKYGWRVDALIDEKCKTGTGVDIHTHGFVENFDHKDLECVLPVDCLVPGDEDLFAKIVHDIFSKILAKIKEGEKFEAGKCYSNILRNGTKLRFLKSTGTDGRDLLRVIIPDANGKLHKSLIREEFKIQFNGV